MTIPGFGSEQALGRSENHYRAALSAPVGSSGGVRLSVRAFAGGVAGFQCNPIVCACRGDVDCNDMFGTNVCGGRAICIDDVCYCERAVRSRAS
jgi:hypothetical protein